MDIYEAPNGDKIFIGKERYPSFPVKCEVKYRENEDSKLFSIIDIYWWFKNHNMPVPKEFAEAEKFYFNGVKDVQRYHNESKVRELFESNSKMLKSAIEKMNREYKQMIDSMKHDVNFNIINEQLTEFITKNCRSLLHDYHVFVTHFRAIYIQKMINSGIQGAETLLDMEPRPHLVVMEKPIREGFYDLDFPQPARVPDHQPQIVYAPPPLVYVPQPARVPPPQLAQPREDFQPVVFLQPPPIPVPVLQPPQRQPYSNPPNSIILDTQFKFDRIVKEDTCPFCTEDFPKFDSDNLIIALECMHIMHLSCLKQDKNSPNCNKNCSICNN